jgi:hypothetical protein
MAEATISRDTKLNMGLVLLLLGATTGAVGWAFAMRGDVQEMSAALMAALNTNSAAHERSIDRLTVSLEQTNRELARTNTGLETLGAALQTLDDKAVIRGNLLNWINGMKELNPEIRWLPFAER